MPASIGRPTPFSIKVARRPPHTARATCYRAFNPAPAAQLTPRALEPATNVSGPASLFGRRMLKEPGGLGPGWDVVAGTFKLVEIRECRRVEEKSRGTTRACAIRLSRTLTPGIAIYIGEAHLRDERLRKSSSTYGGINLPQVINIAVHTKPGLPERGFSGQVGSELSSGDVQTGPVVSVGVYVVATMASRRPSEPKKKEDRQLGQFRTQLKGPVFIVGVYVVATITASRRPSEPEQKEDRRLGQFRTQLKGPVFSVGVFVGTPYGTLSPESQPRGGPRTNH
ncbi:hypothetical protein DFH09DRAFT_1102721 [Mycena vulgaris]|nr:hypothetical protein DFH09DRAFT_1102721 [Mycena vulgaris]